MKRQIRYSVFETNSSMSHSLQVMTKDEYDKIMEYDKSDDWVWNIWDEAWVSTTDINKEYMDEYDYRNSYFDEEADYYIKDYTTEHGDEIVIISMAKSDY